MNDSAADTRSVILERELPYPPEKIWRALTQPELLGEWLMKTDFQPLVDQRFNFTADWGRVDCQVLAVEPHRNLAYSWAANGLESTVTWTLTPTRAGTQLRMEQEGFRPGQEQFYTGAQYGWQRFFGNLETTLAGLH